MTDHLLPVLPPGRVPPHNVDAERSVLGGILLDNASIHAIAEVLPASDFYREIHRKIYEAMLALSEDGKAIDRVTLKDALREMGALEAVGGEAFIDLLDTVVPSASNLVHYATIVHEKALLRRLIEACYAAASQAYEQSDSVASILEESERRILAVTEQTANNRAEPVRSIVKRAFKTIEALYERQEEITGVASGFVDLDRLTAGFQPNDLVIVAGRPSMGKTGWALNLAAHVGCRARFRGRAISVGIFSLEMGKEQLVMRLLASEGRVDSQRVRTGLLLESDWAKLAKAAGELAAANIEIDDTQGLTLAMVRSRANAWATRFGTISDEMPRTDHPLGLIIVDYLQLMRGNPHVEVREQQVSEISRGLKGLAKELGVPVLALSSLNRSLEKRPDKRPMMSDLRESGAIEFDADTILFLFREEVYEKEKEDVKGIAEVIVGKQRNGPTDTIRLAFLHEWTRFETLARDSFTPRPGRNRPHPAVAEPGGD